MKVPVPALEEFRKSISLKLRLAVAAALTVNTPLPAFELSSKSMTPPPAPLPPPVPLTVLALVVKLALPAVEVSEKNMKPPVAPLAVPPKAVNVPLPAVALPTKSMKPSESPLTLPPLAAKAPAPAVALSLKSMWPPDAPLTAVLSLIKAVLLPAVAVLKNAMVPLSPLGSAPATKSCVVVELLLMPAPVIANTGAAVVMLKALAPLLNVIPLTSVSAVIEMPVLFEVASVATSEGPFGGPPADQFVAVFQLPVAGLAFQVALPAKAVLTINNGNNTVVRIFIGELLLLRRVSVVGLVDFARRCLSEPANSQSFLSPREHWQNDFY